MPTLLSRDHPPRWVAGMMYVDDEDVSAIARMRRDSGLGPVTCEVCEVPYSIDNPPPPRYENADNLH